MNDIDADRAAREKWRLNERKEFMRSYVLALVRSDRVLNGQSPTADTAAMAAREAWDAIEREAERE